MLSSIIEKNLNFQKEEYKKIQKNLNQIYEMLTSKKEKEATEIFTNFINKKINIEDIPQSLNLDGSLIMTFSKFWIIIILISLSQLKTKNDKIKTLINLVNISFYNDLNEKKEYKEFYDNLCEEYINDKIAFNAINLNPYLENKLNNINDHLEIKKHYIYLLNKPHCFENNFDFKNKLKLNENINNEKIEDEKKLETVNSLKKLSKKLINQKDKQKRQKKNIINDTTDEESETDIETKKSRANIKNKNKNKNKMNNIKISKKYIIDDENETSESKNSFSDDEILNLNKKKKTKRT